MNTNRRIEKINWFFSPVMSSIGKRYWFSACANEVSASRAEQSSFIQGSIRLKQLFLFFCVNCFFLYIPFFYGQDTPSILPIVSQEESIKINNLAILDFQKAIQDRNILYNKKYYACGDSYTAWSDAVYPPGTEYEGQNVTYDREIRRINRMSGLNIALSGSTIALTKSGNKSADAKAFSNELYKTIPVDTDYVTLAFGINDTPLCNLGEKGDTSNTTFWGAWDTVLKWFAVNRPNTKIGIIIFQRRNNEFYHAMKEIAQWYGVPYLDFYGGINTPMYVDGKAYEVNETIKRERRLYFHGQEHVSADEEVFQGVRVMTKVGDENLSHPGYRAHIDESKIIMEFLRCL